MSAVSTGPYDSGAPSSPVAADVLAAVTEMVRDALSDYGEWPGPIAPNARLDGDLGMQSVELSALQSRLEQRWVGRADLTPLLRGLDLAGLAGLTVADIAARVSGAVQERPCGS